MLLTAIQGRLIFFPSPLPVCYAKDVGKPRETFSWPNDHQTHIWCVCNKNEIVVGARTGGQNKRVIIPVVGGRGRGGESLMGGEEI